jgi:hypothetical protein
MKLVHLNKEPIKKDDTEAEILSLEKTIRDHPTNERAYQRLMILYRKQKNYKKELKTIDTAIRTFEAIFKKRQPTYGQKVKALSKALLKATGLADKKGNSLYQAGELTRWKARRQTVLKKLASH